MVGFWGLGGVHLQPAENLGWRQLEKWPLRTMQCVQAPGCFWVFRTGESSWFGVSARRSSASSHQTSLTPSSETPQEQRLSTQSHWMGAKPSPPRVHIRLRLSAHEPGPPTSTACCAPKSSHPVSWVCVAVLYAANCRSPPPSCRPTAALYPHFRLRRSATVPCCT